MILSSDLLQTYSIKGKPIGVKEPLYFKGAIVKGNYRTYTAKLFDEEGSKGLKRLW